MANAQDTEITLGTGKMLALFFALVALCAVFFGTGFSLGRSSVKPLAGDLTAAPVAASPATRPSAVKPASTASPMTFYKAVEQKDSDTPSTPNEAPSKPAEVAPVAETKPVAADVTTSPATSGYFVQVAAVSKQDDAQALVDALKKKQYPAFTANNSPNDKLFHVQVGPFSDIKDAEGMRSKLVSDGYNPILKK
jgi:DedD protein